MIITREPVMFGSNRVPLRRYMCVQKISVQGKPKTLIADGDTRIDAIVYMLDLLAENGVRATERHIELISDSVEVA